MLEREDSPAAVVILAHRVAQQRTRDPAQRKTLKWVVTRPLYERGYVIRDDSPPTGRELIEAIQNKARLRSLLKSAIQAGSIQEFTRAL
jgi:hypothetical protein